MHTPPPTGLRSDTSIGATAIPVSEFVRQLRKNIEQHFPLGWVSGEISGLTRAGSGHLYFTLKDSQSQMRCAMWRNRAQLLPFQLQEGAHVELRAQATLYEPKGELQLVVEQIRHAGQGNLFEAFMRLKTRLEREGLFDAQNKRVLPSLPRCVGVVTSPSAAALRDVLNTLWRRAPGLRVVLYPSPVQGESAGKSLAEAVLNASIRSAEDHVEALIVCRGGGSLEDLWAFNDEALIRAIRACSIPVISGVGHETDTTLCDFAADLRAATPTAAAELISAGLFDLREELSNHENALHKGLDQILARCAQRLDLLAYRLTHPGQRLANLGAHLQQLDLRLLQTTRMALVQRQHRLADLNTRLARQQPDLHNIELRVSHLAMRLQKAAQLIHDTQRHRIDALDKALTHLAPEQVLQRGFAIVRNHAGQIVRDAAQLTPDESIEITLARGQRTARVS